jgi:hypothetical protein
MKLELLESDLKALKRYLLQNHGMDCRGIRVTHDADCDRAVRKNPRAFAFTIKGSKLIHVSKELEWAGYEARLGVLLHEILHIWLPAFDKDAEIRVDDFATTELKSLGYHYADLNYFSDWSGKIKKYKAKAVEKVSTKFAGKLEAYR